MTSPEPQPLAAGLLRASAPGYAGLVASRLLEEAAPAATAGGDFDAWKRHVEQHLLHLAAALGDAAPQAFAKQLLWTRDAFEARGQSSDALAPLLRIARETLAENLPGGDAVLAPYYDAARDALEADPEPTRSYLDEDAPHGPLAIRYLAALRAGDERTATELVLGPVEDEALTGEEAIHYVLVPALREVGREWHLNRISVAEEHFATAVTHKLLTKTLARAEHREPNGKTVLLTAVAGDCHGFGVQIIAAEFELDGWRTLCLGTDTPPNDLADMAVQYDVDLVGIGATLDTQRQAVKACIEALRRSRPDQPVLVGGQAFEGVDDEAWRRCGADACAPTAREAVAAGRALVGLPKA